MRKLALATDDGNGIGPEIAVKAPAKIVLVVDPTEIEGALAFVGGIRLS